MNMLGKRVQLDDGTIGEVTVDLMRALVRPPQEARILYVRYIGRALGSWYYPSDVKEIH